MESLCFDAQDCDETQDGEEETGEQSKIMAYADFDDQKAQLTISGAIVNARVDGTHPVAFGYGNEMSLFRKGTRLLQASENPFATPVRYTKSHF